MLSRMWHRCDDCEVHWHGSDRACWNCGRTVDPDLTSAPQVTSRQLVPAMRDSEWATIRRELGVA